MIEAEKNSGDRHAVAEIVLLENAIVGALEPFTETLLVTFKDGVPAVVKDVSVWVHARALCQSAGGQGRGDRPRLDGAGRPQATSGRGRSAKTRKQCRLTARRKSLQLIMEKCGLAI